MAPYRSLGRCCMTRETEGCVAGTGRKKAGTSRRSGSGGGNLTPYQLRQAAERARVATESTCETCAAPLLVGLDADHVALIARADVEPVTAAEEVLARGRDGRLSYALLEGPAGRELACRDVITVRCSPAGGPGVVGRPVVVVAHVCPPDAPRAPVAPRVVGGGR